jgi:hypothetical protein
MYNTDFEVKYNDIKNELLTKLHQFEKQLKEEKEEKEQLDFKYNEEDIDIICGKLYRDEFVSVFNANSVFDDIIDKNMRKIYNIFVLNPFFKDFIDIINKELTNKYNYVNQDDEDEDINDNNYIIFMSLFKEEYFYLTHQLICHFMEHNTIDNDLLVIIQNKMLQDI